MRAILLLAFFIACRTAEPSASQSSGTEVAVAPDEPDVVQASPEPVVQAAPEPIIVEDPALACRGRSLHLPTVFTNTRCWVDEEPLMPEAVIVVLETPEITTVEGHAQSNVVLRNPMDAPLEIRLNYACGLEDQISTEIYRGSERVDGTGSLCSGLCGGRTVRLILESGGEARFPVVVTTDVRVAEGCSRRSMGDLMFGDLQQDPVATLSRGDYTLSVNVTFLGQTLEALLHVR